ncbi:MAG: hypothetical protein NTU88_09465, partial [Armatimonadetes bacterium]|nr:hypothetical protein [Armatimonadota bacterium]
MADGKWLMEAAALVLLIGGASHAESKQMEWIKIGKDGRSLVLATSGDLHPHPGPLPSTPPAGSRPKAGQGER